MDWHQQSGAYLSSAVSYAGEFGRYCQLLYVNEEVDIQWTYNGDDRLDNGAVQCLIAPLSNDEIVQSYRVMGDQYPHTRMIWISENGKYIRETTIDPEEFDQIIFSDLIPGKGDYFYAYGEYIFGEDDGDIYHGLLIKYANDGTEIWSRLYRHEYLEGKKSNQYIESIHERDDGSIVIMAKAGERFGGEQFLWLFEVDSEGCFDPDNCDDQQIITSLSEVTATPDDRLLIYPNPADDHITISYPGEGQIRIIDMQGQVVLSGDYDFRQRPEIDIANFPAGIYIARIIAENGTVVDKKFVHHR
jgi:hypothetical protein